MTRFYKYLFRKLRDIANSEKFGFFPKPEPQEIRKEKIKIIDDLTRRD